MRDPRKTRIKLLTCTVTAIGILGVAACSDSDGDYEMGQMQDGMGQVSNSMASSTSAGVSSQFNHADVMFAEMMYPHHAQAVEMSDLVEGRTTNSQLITLAAAIKSAQTPEMEQMAQWLAAWGMPAPHTESGNMGGMDQDGGSMNGMMSQQDMDSLAAKTGTDFDQAWLTMMIEHHQGAIEMANSEVAHGLNPEAKAMAATIITTQRAEIATMTTMLQP